MVYIFVSQFKLFVWKIVGLIKLSLSIK